MGKLPTTCQSAPFTKSNRTIGSTSRTTPFSSMRTVNKEISRTFWITATTVPGKLAVRATMKSWLYKLCLMPLGALSLKIQITHRWQGCKKWTGQINTNTLWTVELWLFLLQTTKTCKTQRKSREAKSSLSQSARTKISPSLKRKSFIRSQILTTLNLGRQVNSKLTVKIQWTLQKCRTWRTTRWLLTVWTRMDKVTTIHITHTVVTTRNSSREGSFYLNMAWRRSFKTRGFNLFSQMLLAANSSSR